MNARLGTPATNTNTELCASCGNFVSELDGNTGWCLPCTKLTTAATLNNNEVAYLKIEAFLHKNADALEYAILSGKTFLQAVKEVSALSVPVCVVCGRVMHRSGKNAVFCRQTKECRRFSRRYVYLYTELHMSKAQALASILAELNT